MFGSHLPANGFNAVPDELGHFPVRSAGAYVENEMAEDFGTARGMDHLGVELKSVDAAGGASHGGDRTGAGLGDGGKFRWHGADLVAMAHPDVILGRHAGKQGLFVQHGDPGAAVFPGGAGLDFTAQHAGGHLHAVTDAEDGDAQIINRGISQRGARLKHAGRATGQDDPGRLAARQFGCGGVIPDDFRIHLLFADPAGNQLGVLGSDIEDGNPILMVHA